MDASKVSFTVDATVTTEYEICINERRFLEVMHIPLMQANVTGEVIKIYLQRTGQLPHKTTKVEHESEWRRDVGIEHMEPGPKPHAVVVAGY